MGVGQQKVQNRLRIDYCSSDVVALAAMQGDVTAHGAVYRWQTCYNATQLGKQGTIEVIITEL